MIDSRRSFLWGVGAALITAPAIVRASSLMQVKQMMLSDGVSLTSMAHPIVIGIDAVLEFDNSALGILEWEVYSISLEGLKIRPLIKDDRFWKVSNVRYL